MKKPTFVPQDFIIPTVLEIDGVLIRPLKLTDAAKDFEVIKENTEHLQKMFYQIFGWPSKDLSYQQELIDLGWHEKEFQKRSSFTYTVLKLNKIIGCIYIFPSTDSEFEADLYFWVTEEEFNRGSDALLAKIVKSWMEVWPFRKVRYPSRTM